MPHVNPTLPSDDTTADVADYNVPIQAILAVFNGHIDGDNIEPGSLPWSVMDTFTNEIPAAAMEDDGNLVKYRDEFNQARVASGMIWSATSGLNADMTTGVVYTPNGKRYSINAVTGYAFTASKDTYITLLSNGSLDYNPLSNGAAPPSLATDATPIALVITNGSAITHVHDMRLLGDEIARIKLGAAQSIMNVAIPARKYLEISILKIASGGALDSNFIFNNDTGSNYNFGVSVDFGANTANNSVSSIALEPGSTDSGQTAIAKLEIIGNISNKEKSFFLNALSQDAAGAANPVTGARAIGKWANTSAQITRLDVRDSASSSRIGAGSEIIVRGWD